MDTILFCLKVILPVVLALSAVMVTVLAYRINHPSHEKDVCDIITMMKVGNDFIYIVNVVGRYCAMNDFRLRNIFRSLGYEISTHDELLPLGMDIHGKCESHDELVRVALKNGELGHTILNFKGVAVADAPHKRLFGLKKIPRVAEITSPLQA